MLFASISTLLGKSRHALAFRRRTFVQHGLFALAGRLTYTDVLVVLRLESDIEFDTAQLPHSVTMRFLSPSEVRAEARDEAAELHFPFVEEALRRGDRCFGVFEQDRLLSYSWYSTSATGVTQELNFEFPQAYVYMHHAFTRPEARGRRLHGASIRAALDALANPRIAGMLAIVSASNVASLKSCARGGFAPLGHFYLMGGLNRLVAVTGMRCRRFGCNVTPRRGGFQFIAVA